jgi:2-hydroxy-3-oxopropionate reductase
MSERKVIGFVGVGVMGNPISKHLIALGHDVLVYDKSEAAVKAMVEAGARAGKDLQDVVNQAPIVFTSLPTPAVFTQVLTGPGGILEGQAVKVVVTLVADTKSSRAVS